MGVKIMNLDEYIQSDTIEMRVAVNYIRQMLKE